MTKQLLSLILSGFILISLSAIGQNADYPTKKVNGIEYYIYTVQPSEGMFSISRRFGVKQADINTANPQIQDGLKAGMQILVPVTAENKKHIQKSVNKSVTTPSTEFIQHKVEKKQTLFAISRLYNVSQEDIKKYNPEAENGIREGMMLKIQKSAKEFQKPVENVEPIKIEKPSEQVSKAENKNYIIHVVQANETLYSISKKYNVDIVAITQLNPGSATSIGLGNELKIPKKESSAKTIVPNGTSDTKIRNSQLNPIHQNNESPKITDNQKPIKIAFLLPFMLDHGKVDSGTERFLDFYGGSLIAIQEAKKNGISFEIYTYDTEKSVEKLTEVLNNPELKSMDLIIGPAFSSQVALMGQFARENKVKVLIPFTAKVPEIENNSYLFQFNPGIEANLKFSKELLLGKLKNYRVIFAEIQGINSFDDGKNWSDNLQDELSKARKNFSRIELSTSGATDFSKVLKRGEKNLIIFNTDKYGLVSSFLPALKEKEKENNIILFEQYSWLNQTNKLTQNIYISPFIVNLNPVELSLFDVQFDQFFKRQASSDIPRYDLLGYDLTNYFVSIINRYGTKFTEKIGWNNNFKWIQSQPLFERISNGSGFMNQRLYMGEDKTE